MIHHRCAYMYVRDVLFTNGICTDFKNHIGNLCKILTEKNIIILTSKHLALILFVELNVLCNATERK